MRKEVPYGTFVRAAKIPLLRRGQHLRRPKDQGPRQRPAAALQAALLRAYAWTEDLCFERAHDKLQKEVPLSEEGLEQALAWLEEQYAAL